MEAIFWAAVLPLSVLYSWVRFVRQENPRRPRLRKASHGAGLVALCVLGFVAVNHAGSIGNFVGPGLADYAGYIELAWGLAIIIGLWLLRIGAAEATGFLDPVGVVGPALVKIGVGVRFMRWSGYRPPRGFRAIWSPTSRPIST